MITSDSIKGILLDYGGTIDTNGIHWGEVIWEAYEQQHLPIAKEQFRKAYSYGEYTLATSPLIRPDFDMLHLLQVKIAKQFDHLISESMLPEGDYAEQINAIALQCEQVAVDAINEAAPVLEYLSEKYPLVMVSNFYGNLNTVLKTFGIRRYFKRIVESAVVGVRKPDPAIFALGVTELGFDPTECLVIGDSYKKDIAPGNTVGCQTTWLKKEGWGDDPEDTSSADLVIGNFAELGKIL